LNNYINGARLNNKKRFVFVNEHVNTIISITVQELVYPYVKSFLNSMYSYRIWYNCIYHIVAILLCYDRTYVTEVLIRIPFLFLIHIIEVFKLFDKDYML